MFISKRKYEELVASRERAETGVERIYKLNNEILSFARMLINKLKEYEKNPLAHPESYLDDTMAIVDDMTMAQRRELLKYLEEKIEGNNKPIRKKEWEVKENAT